MKTYSRRHSKPISRRTNICGSSKGSSGDADGSSGLPPTTPSTTEADKRVSDGRGSCRSSTGSSNRKSNGESRSATSLARADRRLSLAAVPVCSLNKTSTPKLISTASVGALGVERRPNSGGSTGDDGGSGSWWTGGRVSSSVLGVRRLSGNGDPLSDAGRKRRRPGSVKSAPTVSSVNKGKEQQQQQQQQEGSGVKKQSGGVGGRGRPSWTSAGGRKEQTFLDFGQRSLGQRTLCPRCNLLYVRGSADDENRHAALCAKAAEGIAFAGWKQERVKATFPDDGGRVVEIREGDPAPHLAKLREVERVMDADMGFAPDARNETISLARGNSSGGGKEGGEGGGGGGGGAATPGGGCEVVSVGSVKTTLNAFLYVREKRVLGCVVAHRIDTARRAVLLPEATRPEARSEVAAGAGAVTATAAIGSGRELSVAPARVEGLESPPAAFVVDVATKAATAAASVAAETFAVYAVSTAKRAGAKDQPERKGAAEGAVSCEDALSPRQREENDNDNHGYGSSAGSSSPFSYGSLNLSRAVNTATKRPMPRFEDGGTVAIAPRPRPCALDCTKVGDGGVGTVAVVAPTTTKKRKMGGGGDRDGGSATTTGSNATASAASLSPTRSSLERRALKREYAGKTKSTATTLESFWLPRRNTVPSATAFPAAAAAATANPTVAKPVGEENAQWLARRQGSTVPDPPAHNGQEDGEEARAAVVEVGGAIESTATTVAPGRCYLRCSDIQDLRAWSDGNSATAAAASPSPAEQITSARDAEEQSAGASSEEQSFPPTMGGGRCRGSAGAGDIRSGGDSRISGAGTRERGGERGEISLLLSASEASALAAVETETTAILVRASSPSRGPVGLPVAEVVGAGSKSEGSGPAPSTVARNATRAAVEASGATLSQPKPAGGAGWGFPIKCNGGGGGAEPDIPSEGGNDPSTPGADGRGDGGRREQREAEEAGGKNGRPCDAADEDGGPESGDAKRLDQGVGDSGSPRSMGGKSSSSGVGGGGGGVFGNVMSTGEEKSSRPMPPLAGDGRAEQQQRQERPRSRSWSMDSESTADSEVSSPPDEKENEAEKLPPLPTMVLTCEDKETPAVVGILQVWVHEQSRRQGVATRLVDTAREKMVYGVSLRRGQVAFSQPTREGLAFATRYTGGQGELLVY